MTNRYAKNYRILGIPPGTSWKELRRAYRSLVNTWHPDRFQQDTRKHTQAEEKTKELTQSYNELAQYYKAFGALPFDAETTDSPVAGSSAPPPVQRDRNTASENRGSEQSDVKAARDQTRKHRRSRIIGRIIIATLLAGTYFLWRHMPWEHSETAPAVADHPGQASVAWEETDANGHAPTGEKRFTVGSRIGDVYAIQGVPTKTENDIWYYGNSKVYFVNGKVVQWEENSDNPLQVKIIPDGEKTDMASFGKGSSKEEVLAVQGAPDRDAGSVWDYGVSRVYFEKDRVKGWYESPFNSLRVRR
jgi:hypothetical protein